MCTGRSDDTELAAGSVPAQDPLSLMAGAALLLLSSPQHPGAGKSGKGHRTRAAAVREMLPALDQTNACLEESGD